MSARTSVFQLCGWDWSDLKTPLNFTTDIWKIPNTRAVSLLCKIPTSRNLFQGSFNSFVCCRFLFWRQLEYWRHSICLHLQFKNSPNLKTNIVTTKKIPKFSYNFNFEREFSSEIRFKRCIQKLDLSVRYWNCKLVIFFKLEHCVTVW